MNMGRMYTTQNRADTKLDDLTILQTINCQLQFINVSKQDRTRSDFQTAR